MLTNLSTLHNSLDVGWLSMLCGQRHLKYFRYLFIYLLFPSSIILNLAIGGQFSEGALVTLLKVLQNGVCPGCYPTHFVYKRLDLICSQKSFYSALQMSLSERAFIAMHLKSYQSTSTLAANFEDCCSKARGRTLAWQRQ